LKKTLLLARSTSKVKPGSPNLIVLAGPNGAGKSTAAPALLQGKLAVSEFVNADIIARGLSAFEPEAVAFQAARIMLQRLRTLGTQRENFAFETTLASRTFAQWIEQLTKSGYRFHLIYLWLPDPDTAIARVADRVKHGGHAVPSETIRRRYQSGLQNFFELYKPLAFSWRIYDNSDCVHRRLIAFGNQKRTIVRIRPAWSRIQEKLAHE
jgi:predicted ABC-type ATPase